jgi:hypothetical protein
MDDHGRARAEAVAAAALEWMAEAGQWGAFSAATGMGADDLRAAMATPQGRAEGLGAVLDFVMTRDDWVIEAAACAGVPPEAIARARAALPGGEQMNWT